MKVKIAILFLTVAIVGCNPDSQSNSRFNLDAWNRVKTHQADKTEPLYTSFGPVVYDVYINPLLSGHRNPSEPIPAGTEIAIRVYSGDRSLQKTALWGFISKKETGAAASKWEITAYDANKNPLSEEQVKSSCRGCHSANDDNIILGTY